MDAKVTGEILRVLEQLPDHGRPPDDRGAGCDVGISRELL